MAATATLHGAAFRSSHELAMWLHNAMQSITVSRWKPQRRTTAAND